MSTPQEHHAHADHHWIDTHPLDGRCAVTLAGAIALLPPRWRWTVHNLIAHPLSELLFQVGAERLGTRIHDATIPAVGAPDPRG